jgi:hypothetical protein
MLLDILTIGDAILSAHNLYKADTIPTLNKEIFNLWLDRLQTRCAALEKRFGLIPLTLYPKEDNPVTCNRLRALF